MAKLSERELRAILAAEKQDALSAINASKLTEERTRALDYYMGDMSDDMPTPKDRSGAVSSDVADTVEGLMPSLMEIFASGEEVVEFQPVGIEDEEAAEQETDYVNHVFMQQNPGFLTLYSFIKDALLQKVGIVKVWWEEKEEESRETLLDLPDDAYAMLAAEAEENDSLDIVEHSERQDEESGLTLHDVTVAKRQKKGRAHAEPVPPEEFGVSRRATSIHVKDADYCFHSTQRTESELIDQGYDAAQVRKLPSDNDDQGEVEEELARDTVEESDVFTGSTQNKANRPISVTEHYCRLDYEGTGKARLYRIVTAGGTDEVLKRGGKPDIEAIDFMPFAAMTPVIMTHRFFGRSIADLVMDIQRIKTALLRGLLDNVYLANNQRIELAESHAHEKTLDDLLANRPGGVVRTKQPGGLVPIPNQPIGNFAFPMIEYMDATREWRTGVTKQGQGLNPTALQNIGENAILDAANAARARTKLIARIFAETGVRDLFALLHATIRKHDTQQHTVRLRNKWIEVDPQQWRERWDMTINVGLGSGGKEQQLAFLMSLLQIQREAIQAPQLGLVKPDNIYASLKKLVELGGLKSVEPYFSDPAQRDPNEPIPPDPAQQEAEQKMQLEQAKLQMDQQKTQAQMQMESQKAQAQMQTEQQKIQLQSQADMQKTQAEMEAKRYQIDAEMGLKREQLVAELQLKREQLQAELELKREMGMVNAAVKAETAATSSVKMGGDPG